MEGVPLLAVALFFVVGIFVVHWWFLQQRRCPRCRCYPVPDGARKCPYCTANLPEDWQEK